MHLAVSIHNNPRFAAREGVAGAIWGYPWGYMHLLKSRKTMLINVLCRTCESPLGTIT